LEKTGREEDRGRISDDRGKGLGLMIVDCRLMIGEREKTEDGRWMRDDGRLRAGDVQALVGSGLSARRIAVRLNNEHREAEI